MEIPARKDLLYRVGCVDCRRNREDIDWTAQQMDSLEQGSEAYAAHEAQFMRHLRRQLVHWRVNHWDGKPLEGR